MTNMNVDTIPLPARHFPETTIVKAEWANRLQLIGLINTKMLGKCVQTLGATGNAFSMTVFLHAVNLLLALIPNVVSLADAKLGGKAICKTQVWTAREMSILP